MPATLYRKYRPQNFSDVVDQQHVRITLQHALEQDRLAHAYIFAGPRGVGKTTLARILARAVNCTKRGKNGEPCNTCPNCQAILQNASLDIIEIDAASQTGVDNVRENIIQSARSIPSLGKYKVFIIDEVHMLSTAAFNALLKILEEPPAHAIFILATTEIHRLPETIISRTQRFDFKKLGLDDIIARLEKITGEEKRELETGVAGRIASQSGGSLRDAESMLGQLFSLADKKITNDLADLILPRSDRALLLSVTTSLLQRQPAEAITAFHKFCDEGGDIPVFIHELIAVGRLLLLASVDRQLVPHIKGEYDPALIEPVLSLAAPEKVGWLTQYIDLLLMAEKQVYQATMMELPVEVAMISSAMTTGSAELAAVPMNKPVATSAPSTKPKAEPPPSAPKTKSKKSAAPADTRNLEEITAGWQKVQRSIGQVLPSLGLSVQHATVLHWDGAVLTVGVPFALHRQRLNDPKNRHVLEDHVSKEVGQPIKIDVQQTEAVPDAPVSGSPEAPTKTSATGSGNDLWDQMVATFS